LAIFGSFIYHFPPGGLLGSNNGAPKYLLGPGFFNETFFVFFLTETFFVLAFFDTFFEIDDVTFFATVFFEAAKVEEIETPKNNIKTSNNENTLFVFFMIC
jgi:hypothetical protein